MAERDDKYIPNDVNIHRKVGGQFKEGTTWIATDVLTERVVLSAAGAVRLRLLMTGGAGTLKIEYLRAGGVAVYAAKAIVDQAIVAGTEKVIDFNAVGERGLKLTFTPTAANAGTVTYFDISAIYGTKP